MKFTLAPPALALCLFLLPAPASPDTNLSARAIIELWPTGNPGNWKQAGPETSEYRGGVTRIKNISTPTLTVYPPKKGVHSQGKGIVVCPGGGYSIEAIDKEGYEIAEFLASRGYYAFVLKYRLPTQAEKKAGERYVPALQDAQRALSIIRQRAPEWGIKKLGIMGFSAGGHLSATVSAHAHHRTYPPVDDADKSSCAPDFVALIYPAYLVPSRKSPSLAPEVKVTPKTPPTFLAQASDDPIGVENSLFYFLALKQNKVPGELHIYAKGGHGYGLRPMNAPARKTAIGAWPELFARWLERQ